MLRRREETRFSLATIADCAEEIAQTVSVLSQSSPEVVIALCGGSSPKALYTAMIPALTRLSSDARRALRFVPLDERNVPSADSQHNLAAISAMLMDQLVKSGAISESQIVWYEVASAAESSLSGFNQRFAAIGGKIDIGIAGSGEDGHIASLFPGLPAVADSETADFVFVENSPKPPPKRISASRRLITEATLTVGIFLKGKEGALAHFRSDSSSIETDCPAKLLRYSTQQADSGVTPRLFVLSDIE